VTKETDRELLELAAKAAGIAIDYSTMNGGGFGNTGFDMMGNAVLDWHNAVKWNPLTDDGDAFRLAIQLRMCVDTWGVGVVSAAVLLKNRVFVAEEQRGDDAEDATRHAIVRAAAEIGRAMP
jgi:hypothetical protein